MRRFITCLAQCRGRTRPIGWLFTKESGQARLICQQDERESMAFQETQQEAILVRDVNDDLSLPGPLNDPTEIFIEPTYNVTKRPNDDNLSPNYTYEESTEDIKWSNRDEIYDSV